MRTIQISDFGITKNGDEIKKYTLINKNGMQAEIINYGGIVTSLTAPDRNGKYEDVVLGFTKPENYFNDNGYFFGALIGRYANRIAHAEFSLEGEVFTVDKNDNSNCLHGGRNGFHTQIWNVEPIENNEFSALKLTHTSEDGESGFPGKLLVTVIYTLTDDDTLEIFYEATTDKTTVINLTHHSYFNLSGDFTKTIVDHEVQINADQFLPINDVSVPTGEKRMVKETPFDFTTFKKIGKDIDEKDAQLEKANGYDHNWILNGEGLRTIAKVYHSKTGRAMEVISDQPGVQFYSGNFLDGKYETKTGGKNASRTGFCLETQHYPDTPNQSSFPSTELKPGEKYQSQTIYKFSVRNDEED
ncbi:aldose epimerase family protein [Chryseobacterium taiwanense]|uniref:Aldose 1-epimerase n=1 Tax=Chryseobacterium taiwanense TaxID=363331 RepID=A0A0B4DBC7_9FLAO|nr:aldose epimerase family protein [Chryseobacterium taiwanense]KIC64001.1 aldose epimerase [Chryseobacterium taiwanense]